MQVVAAGANPVLITRGIEKTTKALVAELKKMSKEVIVCLDQILLVMALVIMLKRVDFFSWDCRSKIVNLQMLQRLVQEIITK